MEEKNIKLADTVNYGRKECKVSRYGQLWKKRI